MRIFFLPCIFITLFFANTLPGQTLDLSFPEVDGVVSTTLIHGKTLYIGGFFTAIGGQPRKNLAAIDLVTHTVTDWAPLVNSGVSDIAAADGVVYICGEFKLVNNSSRNTLAALDSATNTLLGFVPNIVFPGVGNNQGGFVGSIDIHHNILYLGGYFISVDGLPRPNVAAIDLANGAVTSFNPQPDIPVNIVEADGDLLYMGGLFNNVNGYIRRGFASVTLADGLITNWKPQAGGPGNSQYAILPVNNQVYISGSFTELNGGLTKNYLAQTDMNGIASSWDAGLPEGLGVSVRALAFAGGYLFAGGTFTLTGQDSHVNLAMLDTTTGEATAWNPAPDDGVVALTTSDSLLIVGGRFHHIAGEDRQGLAVFHLSQLVNVLPDVPSFNTTVTVFPVPATNQLTVTLGEGSIHAAQLFAADGRRLNVAVHLADHTATIETQDLPSGIYWLQIVNNAGERRGVKVVK